MAPRLSVCIPAYNRPKELQELLDSITDQDFDDYEIVICEDGSPCRAQIQQVVRTYQVRYPNRIQYFENVANLGYDGNIRELFHKAQGDYVLLMGNDDLMAEGALLKIASALERYAHVGVILRSYSTFSESLPNIYQVHRYFDTERFFPAGATTAVTFYRRVVVVSGLVMHRASAIQFDTERFDGTLLYQVYLAANILLEMNGVFLPDIVAYYRLGATPDFGNSAAEQGLYTPGMQTPESSLNFIKGFLDIAKHVDLSRHVNIYQQVLDDTGNYAYPLLAIQARQQPLLQFLSYVYQLEKLGLWRNVVFQGYAVCLIVLGHNRMDRLISWVKTKIGHTPVIGRVYQGETNSGDAQESNLLRNPLV